MTATLEVTISGPHEFALEVLREALALIDNRNKQAGSCLSFHRAHLDGQPILTMEGRRFVDPNEKLASTEGRCPACRKVGRQYVPSRDEAIVPGSWKCLTYDCRVMDFWDIKPSAKKAVDRSSAEASLHARYECSAPGPGPCHVLEPVGIEGRSDQ